MTAEAILSRLERVRTTGRGTWLARCPAHEDRSPSFSLRELDDGRIVCHCFAGCSFEAIVQAVGLGWDAWFPPKPLDPAKPLRRVFPAHDVLQALACEAHLVRVAAGNLARGMMLSGDDLDRLMVAGERIDEAMRLANG